MIERADGPKGCSTWIAIRDDGSAYSDATGATYTDLRADGHIQALRLERGEQKVVVVIPKGMRPVFLRRASVTANVENSNVEWGACVGWEDSTGALVVSWLLANGAVVTTNTFDLTD